MTDRCNIHLSSGALWTVDKCAAPLCSNSPLKQTITAAGKYGESMCFAIFSLICVRCSKSSKCEPYCCLTNYYSCSLIAMVVNYVQLITTLPSSVWERTLAVKQEVTPAGGLCWMEQKELISGHSSRESSSILLWDCLSVLLFILTFIFWLACSSCSSTADRMSTVSHTYTWIQKKQHLTSNTTNHNRHYKMTHYSSCISFSVWLRRTEDYLEATLFCVMPKADIL